MFNRLTRYIGAVSALVFSLSAFGAHAAEMTPVEAKLYEAAKPEGKVVWYVSQFNTEAADNVCRLFRERYPDLGCDAVRASAQVLLQRLMQELSAGVPQADVVSTTDSAQLVELKGKNALVPYKPDNLQFVSPSLMQFNEPDGYWFITGVSPLIIGYNTDRIKPEDAPKKWSDLLDPRWKNQVAIAHPGFSGGAGIWAIAMRDLYGWEFFEKLEENSPQITRSAGENINTVSSGERSISIVTANSAATEALKGAAVASVFPEDGAVLPPGATAVLDKAPHTNAARLFAEFLLSPEVSEYYVSEERFSLRPDVAQPKDMPALEDIKLILVPDSKVVDEVPEIRSLFRDTFGI